MNKIGENMLIAGTVLCVVGGGMFAVGYFSGGKDFTYASRHMYISGGNTSTDENLAVMKKQRIDSFTKLNVDFDDFDLDIRTSDDDNYYMEYKLKKIGTEDPLTWENKDGELTLKETAGGCYVVFDLGFFQTMERSQDEKINTVILYVPKKAQLSNAQIQLGDGDMEMKHAPFNGSMEIHSSDGDVFIQMEKGSTAKTDIYLESTDGDVDTEDLPQGKSYSKGDTSVYENRVDGSTSTLNVKCGDGDITLTESDK